MTEVISELEHLRAQVSAQQEQLNALNETVAAMRELLFRDQALRGESAPTLYAPAVIVYDRTNGNKGVHLSARRGGNVDVFDENGEDAGSFFGDLDGGELHLYHENRLAQVHMGCDDNGGYLSLNKVDGGDIPNGVMPNSASGVELKIDETGGQLLLNDCDDNLRAVVGAGEEGGEFALFTKTNAQGVYATGRDDLSVVKLGGREEGSFAILTNNGKTPGLHFYDEERRLKARLTCKPEGEGVLVLFKDEDQPVTILGSTELGGALMLLDGNNGLRATLNAMPEGARLILMRPPVEPPSEDDDELSFNGEPMFKAFCDRETSSLTLLNGRGETGWDAMAAKELNATTLHTDGERAGIQQFASGSSTPMLMVNAGEGDAHGTRVALTCSDDSGTISTSYADGKHTTLLGGHGTRGVLSLTGESGRPYFSVSHEIDGPAVRLHDEDGDIIAAMSVGDEGGALSLRRTDAELGAQLSAREEGGTLELFNAIGEIDVSLPTTSE